MKSKVIVINFGGLGDQILFLPSLWALKKFFSQDEIFFITEARSKIIARLSDSIDEKKIISFDYKSGNKVQKALELILLLRSGNYSHIFSTGASWYVSFILFLSGIKNRFYLTKDDLKKHQTSYHAELLFEPIKKLSKAKFKNPHIDLKASSEQKQRIDEIIKDALSIDPENLGQELIAVHPGVSELSKKKGMNKQWSAQDWAELINQLNKKHIFLCSGPEDNQIIQEIKSLIKADLKIIDMSQRTQDIAELAYLFSKMNCVICHDSGPMHLSYSLGIKTIAFFADTKPEKLIPPDMEHIYPIRTSDNKDAISKTIAHLQ